LKLRRKKSNAINNPKCNNRNTIKNIKKDLKKNHKKINIKILNLLQIKVIKLLNSIFKKNLITFLNIL
jgi:hypothetical protein